MFTGLVQNVATVAACSGEQTRRLTLTTPLAEHCQLGDSVAVNGVCLTVTDLSLQHISFDVVAETLKRSNLGLLRVNDKTNCELALRPSDRLGGHFVQGHVDDVGVIKSIIPDDEAELITIAFPERLAPYLIDKGFICVDGMSLTIITVNNRANTFCFTLIPHSKQHSSAAYYQLGQTVNLEVDMLAKYAHKQLQQRSTPQHA